jgi:mRNA interferase MazF
VTGRPVRGMIVEVDLDPVVGHEQGRPSPCVVVQSDAGNRFSSMTIIVPFTDAANIRRPSAIYVLVKKGAGGLGLDSILLSDQIRAVDLVRVRRMIGVLPSETMRGPSIGRWPSAWGSHGAGNPERHAAAKPETIDWLWPFIYPLPLKNKISRSTN